MMAFHHGVAKLALTNCLEMLLSFPVSSRQTNRSITIQLPRAAPCNRRSVLASSNLAQRRSDVSHAEPLLDTERL